MKITNEDNMELMARYEDNYFDLAIVDPPYGIARFGSRVCDSDRIKDSKINKWDIAPTTEYFCVWDKQQSVDNFASAEYCWVSMSLKKPAKVFRYSIHKTMAERKSEGGKIHPTQKPVKLYEWLLHNYAKEGDKILDTHLGSGSIAIACHNMKFDLTACELDKEYYEKAMKRITNHMAQQRLF